MKFVFQSFFFILVISAAGNDLENKALNGSGWEKVRAAEALIKMNQMTPEVLRSFDESLKNCPADDTLRIGLLRVLYKASPEKEKRIDCLNEIRSGAFGSMAGMHCHGVETLAKLKYRVDSAEARILEEYIKGDNKLLAAYSTWLLYYNDPERSETSLLAMLTEKSVSQATAAYAFKHLDKLRPETLDALRHILSTHSCCEKTEEYLREIPALKDISE